MNPYWSSERHGLEIYHGDCLEILPGLEREFDLCLTDPDYFVDQSGSNLSADFVGAKDGSSFDFEFFGSDLNGNLAAQRAFIYAALDAIGQWIAPGCAVCMFFAQDKTSWIYDWINEDEWERLPLYVWVKKNPMPQLRRVKWSNGTETAAMIAKCGKRNFNRDTQQRPNYTILPVGRRDRHATEKPVDLFKPVIEYWSLPGQSVLDPSQVLELQALLAIDSVATAL